MESPLSRIRFVDRDGSIIDAPREWTPARIEILVESAQWEQVYLTRNSAEVEVRPSRRTNCVIADWPCLNAGSYLLHLSAPNINEERHVFIVPALLSSEAYSHLLDDLIMRLPAAVAIGLQQAGALADITIRPPGESTLAQEVVRLQRAVLGDKQWPGLKELLPKIAINPYTTLVSTTTWTSSTRARRPHPANLVRALAKAENMDDNGMLREIEDTRAMRCVDVYENRLIKLLAHHIHRRLQRLKNLLRTRAPSRQTTDLLSTVDTLLHNLQRTLRASTFLDNVSFPMAAPTKTTMVLQRQPLYRAVFERYLELNRSPTVTLNEPALAAPLDNLPRLYQIWGTLQVLDALLAAANDLGYRVTCHALVQQSMDGVFVRVLPASTSLVVLDHASTGTTAFLLVERKYHRNGDLRSISREQRPDIALEVRTRGRDTRVYLFDPKYKCDDHGEPHTADIDKMHTYRDAICNERQQRVVAYAAILFPGKSRFFGSAVAALSAIPGAAQELQETLRQICTTALALDGGSAHVLGETNT